MINKDELLNKITSGFNIEYSFVEEILEKIKLDDFMSEESLIEFILEKYMIDEDVCSLLTLDNYIKDIFNAPQSVFETELSSFLNDECYAYTSDLKDDYEDFKELIVTFEIVNRDYLENNLEDIALHDVEAKIFSISFV